MNYHVISRQNNTFQYSFITILITKLKIVLYFTVSLILIFRLNLWAHPKYYSYKVVINIYLIVQMISSLHMLIIHRIQIFMYLTRDMLKFHEKRIRFFFYFRTDRKDLIEKT